MEESDDADHLTTDDIVGIRHISTTSQEGKAMETKPSMIRENSKSTSQTGAWVTGIHEYQSLEKHLDSSLPNHKKRRDMKKRIASDNSGTPRSSLAPSQSESIELLDPEITVKPAVKEPYRGTANLYPSQHSRAVLGGKAGRTTGGRSPHFPMPNGAAPLGERELVKVFADGKPAGNEPQLRHLYRDTNGRRRSGADQSSSDELVTARPNSRALSPVKTARSQTPMQIPQQDPPDISLAEKESFDAQQVQSNIRPSTFTQSGKHETRPASRTHTSINLKEEPAPWSVAVAAYNSQGRTHQDDSLGLVYMDRMDSYDIHQSGKNLAAINPELRIQPAKLLKISFAIDGTMIRFKSSKTGTVENVLDIELRFEKDVQELIAMLQVSGSIFVKGETRDWMAKCFAHRLEDQRKGTTVGRVSPSKDPADVVLTGRRLDRADKKRDLEEQVESKTKRPRLVDGLAQSDSRIRTRPSEPPKTRQTPRNRQIHAQEQPNTPHELNVTPLDDYLSGYSLRSHKEGRTSSSNRTKDPPHAFEPSIERYSKTHDMGKRWVKPLVYPKEGKRRTTVEWSDIERLDEGEFLNDNLVAFYLRYLEHQAEQRDPTVSRKVYMFNTFFYERLTDTKRGHRGINYEAVKKWTRGVDLFTYDFVVVPVNEAYHWYVAIICNLPALSRKLGGFESDLGDEHISSSEHDKEPPHEGGMLFSSSPQRTSDDVNENQTAASFAEMSLDNDNDDKDAPPASQGNSKLGNPDQAALDEQLQDPVEERENKGGKQASSKSKKGRGKSGTSPRKFDPYRPSILTFDSFGTTHATAIRALKLYLQEEASDKRGQMEFDEKDLQGVTAKEIPLQSNFYDCGLYILGYIEKFFNNPREFVNKVMRHEWDKRKDWPNLDPSRMRHTIRELLMSLYAEKHRERVNSRRSKTSTKSPHGPTPQPAEGEKGLSSTDDGKEPTSGRVPKPDLEESRPTAPLDTAVLGPAQKTKSNQQEQFTDQPKTETRPPSEPMPPPAASHEEHPQSFILLDSQSQQVNAAPPSKDPEPTKAFPISPELPSTIPDSQPGQAAETPIEEPRQISPPIVKKPRRHMDSFSSPPPAPKHTRKAEAEQESPGSHKSNAEQTTPKTRGMKRSSGRSSGGSSGGSSKPVVTGTHPKVVIHLD